MPFAPRSFGSGRRPLVKPSSAAMQQFRGGSPSVAPVPLRMPARPPVANRMQQYNTPPQMPPGRSGPFVPPPMPREMPTPPGGGGVLKMPETGGYSPVPPATTMPRRFGGFSGGIFESDGAGGMRVIEPGPGNELGSTGQRGMPKYDPRGMGGGEYQMPRNTGYGGGGPRNPDGTPVATTGMGINEDLLMQPGGGGFSKLDPRYTNPMSGGFVGPSRSGSGELLQTGRMSPKEMQQYGGGIGVDAGGARTNSVMPGGNELVGHHGIGFGQDSPLARDNPQFGMPPMPPEMNQLHRTQAFKRGGQVQAYAKGGRVTAKPVAKKAVKAATPAKTASRGDGIAQRGRTKGTMR